jgi:L-ribulokinase
VETICRGDASTYDELTIEATNLQPGESGLLALDWNNGNRTILVDPRLTGLILGQTLYTTRAEIYRALIEATAFGAREIIERLRKYGVTVDRVVCCGGIAEKNPLLMQIYADVFGLPIHVAGSAQACALGAAISATVLAGTKKGGHSSFAEAQKVMTNLKSVFYSPDAKSRKIYDHLYALYQQLHDSFGGVAKNADLSRVMKDLLDLKQQTPNPAPTPSHEKS